MAWRHVAVVKEQDEVTVYVDGVRVGEASIEGDAVSAGVWVGEGVISEVFIGAEALTGAQVRKLHGALT